ncbi:hypothetical protein [Streptomyces sp. NPDC047061]|uniref:hypothetical protein n=1 Tax=Streptomyces sp. NPDC047061 TaxID=3154605 RepID=UPI0033EAEAD7
MRHIVGSWIDRTILVAYLPLTGTVRDRVGAAVRDPAASADLRWLDVQYLYGPVVDGLRAVVLPLVGRLAGLDAKCSESLSSPR